MKIRVVLLDTDLGYLNRLAGAIRNKYQEEIEPYLFTDYESAITYIKENHINMLAANESFATECSKLIKQIGIVLLSENNEEGTKLGKRLIGKYQMVDTICKAIISVYSEVADHNGVIIKREGKVRNVIAFTSIGGGMGSTTAAIACAKNFTEKGMKVLYVNLERFPSAVLFQKNKPEVMKALIFAIKSKGSNLGIKAMGEVLNSQYGFDFLPISDSPLDMTEMNGDDCIYLLKELCIGNSYDCIIVDFQFTMDQKSFKILDFVDKTIIISDGSEIANQKINHVYKELCIIENGKKYQFTYKLMILYNRVSSRYGKRIEDLTIPVLGGTPRIDGTTKEIMQQISEMKIFHKLL